MWNRRQNMMFSCTRTSTTLTTKPWRRRREKRLDGIKSRSNDGKVVGEEKEEGKNISKRDDLHLLPGDPSLVVHVSCEMGLGIRADFMKEMSKHIAETLSKPETYVCVCVHDDVSMTWGGKEEPCTLGTLKSIGGINLENNKKVMQNLCEILERDFMIPKNRVYVEFENMERENCGYDGATFGG